METKTPRRSREKAPDDSRSDDRLNLRLAEYSAPFGEEMPWRTATSDFPEASDAWRDLKPERGRLH